MEGSRECVICKTGVAPAEPVRRRTRWSREVPVEDDNEGLSCILKLLVKTSRNSSEETSLGERETGEPQPGGSCCVTQAVENLKGSRYSVCRECANVTSRALQTKIRVEKEEKRVIELQTELLEAVRTLQAEMDTFHEEMSKIGNTIRATEPASIPPDKTDDDGKKSQGENDAVLIRDELLEVLTDLRICKTQLEDRLVLDRMEEQTMTEAATYEVDVDCDYANETENFLETGLYTDEAELNSVDEPPAAVVNPGSDASSDNDLSDCESDTNEELPLVGHIIGIVRDAKHDTEGKFSCDLCGDKLKSQNMLTRHTKKFHPQSTPKSSQAVTPNRLSDASISEKMLSKALGIMSEYISGRMSPQKRPSPGTKENPQLPQKPSHLPSPRKPGRKPGQKIHKPNNNSPSPVVTTDKTKLSQPPPPEQPWRSPPTSPPPSSTSHALSDEEKDNNPNPDSSKLDEEPVEKKPRRSTRGRCVLNIKELLDMPIADETKRRRKHSSTKETVKKED